MGCDAVIPQGDCALFPLDANLEILSKGDMLWLKGSSQRCESNVSANCVSDAYVEQELQKSIRLLMVEANNALSEALVNKQSLFTRHLWTDC